MKPEPDNDIASAFNDAGLIFPRTLTLALTNACNLFCTHCWVEARPQAAPTVVPMESIRGLIEEFSGMGGEGIRLTGGEPLLHPNCLEFMEFAFSIGFPRVELQTNALLLGNHEIEALGRVDCSGLNIQISLDGANPESHDRIRGQGNFAGVLAAINRLAGAGLANRTSLFFTETAHNLEEFPAVLELGRELGLKSVLAGTLIAGGRAAEGGGGLRPPTPGQYAELLEFFQADSRFQYLYSGFGTMAAIEWWLGKGSGRPCCSLGENPYITPEGVMYPCLLCHCDEFGVKRVFDRSLEESLMEGAGLWKILNTIAAHRGDNISVCGDCPEKSVCAGGCPGRAWGSCGDLLTVDDRCEIRRVVGQKKRNHEIPS